MSTDNDAIPEQQGPVKNWAQLERVRERVKAEIIPLCEEIRQARLPLETFWQRYEKAWTMEHEFQNYFGRSNIYMPVANKQVETLVGELVTATFPGDDFFNVEATKPDWQQMAGDVKALEHQRMKNSKVRAYAEAYYRQLLIKGNSPARVHWVSKKKRGHLRRQAVQSLERDIMNGGSPYTFNYYEGPRFSPIPAANFYAYPENASSLDDATVVFEDLTVNRPDLIFAAKYQKRYVVEEAMAAKGKHQQAGLDDQQRLWAQGFADVTDARALQRVGITHCFLSMDPNSDSFENDVDMQDMCITFSADGHVLRVIDAEFVCPGRCHPYVNGRAGTIVGRMWGTGFIERIYPLQLLINDQVNQSMDGITYQLNPIVLTNPDLIVGTLPDLEPGMQALVHDVTNAVRFERPPDFINGASTLLNQTMSWMQDFFGSPPVLQGGSTPGRAFKTAMGVGTADKNAKTPLTQMVRLQETDVWQPMLEMFWLLDQRFADQKVLIEQGGISLVQNQRWLDPMSIYGEYKFGWLASTQAESMQMLASQLQSFIQLVIAPGVMQTLQGEGLKVQLGPLIERIYRALGLRDIERVLIKSDGSQGIPSDAVKQQEPVTVPPPPPQPPQPGQMGGPQNALNGNQGQEQDPRFQAMRQTANMLAAHQGGNNNGGGGGPGGAPPML